MTPIGHNAIQELISAISALNTEVTYTGPRDNEYGLVYISDAEPLVNHSIEHIHSAITVLEEFKQTLSAIRPLIDKDKYKDYLALENSIITRL